MLSGQSHDALALIHIEAPREEIRRVLRTRSGLCLMSSTPWWLS